ncbi:PQQ-dependent sugar dehydrogenase [Novosphingobium acidiphilum]|uniref:PQQ-dependent sugar dehydrogenase n=1 Tax=Novosphingobium acidiphilum TaxID=505248 RepID=UPI00041C65F6|nr:PQQ-dependent sugar dehydrogenase [Novosphingobium acidiphilum]
MTMLKKTLIGLGAVLVVTGGFAAWVMQGDVAQIPFVQTTGPHPKLTEPRPQTFPTVGVARPIGWKPGESPVAAAGLAVSRFADGLNHPRTLYVLPNGDVLTAETNAPPASAQTGLTGLIARYLFRAAGAGGPSPNTLVLLRDSKGTGTADQRFAMTNPALNSPFGMVWREGRIYVANNDAVVSWPFQPGQTSLVGKPDKLMDLPAGGEHWARNLVLTPDGSRMYVSVGSATNIADDGIEHEQGRAAIYEYDFAKHSARQYAGGMRNPNGMDFNPRTGELWTVVNERDMLGSDLVPDYLTNVPLGAEYGWPWVYWKKNPDWRVQTPMPQDMMDYVRKPEYALGAHVAPLGLAFAQGGNLMGPRFASGAFIARHGSWNRKPLAGYDVVFVGFDDRGNALPVPPVPVLTGFLAQEDHTHGRPVWVGFAHDGALLVSDDVGGVIWRVVAPGARPAAAIVPIPSHEAPPPPKAPLHYTIKRDDSSDLNTPQQ